MASMTAGPGFRLAFNRDETTTWVKYAPGFPQSRINVLPVVHGGDRPDDRSGAVLQWDFLSDAFDVPHLCRSTGQEPCYTEHDGGRIDPGDRRALSPCITHSDSRATPDVDDRISGTQTTQAHGQTSVTFPADGHAERSQESYDTAKCGIVGVMIGRRERFGHALTLTVEPGFKSSGCMSEPLLTIGEVGERAHVATSTIRYYERIGLVVADTRMSGQRRYRVATLRRLVFVGMLQDAGLSLPDIAAILNAADVDEWKDIARRRLEALDHEIAALQQARSYLAGALFCRFDHPLKDCQVMGAEIDKRLASNPTP